MKFYQLAFFCLALFSFVACGDDDMDTPANNCTQSDWTGTYIGVIDCGEEGIDSTVLTIIASGADIIISHEESDEFGSASTTYGVAPFDGCDFDSSFTEDDITLVADATLDGDDLTLRETISSGGTTLSCTIRVTRD